MSRWTASKAWKMDSFKNQVEFLFLFSQDNPSDNLTASSVHFIIYPEVNYFLGCAPLHHKKVLRSQRDWKAFQSCSSSYHCKSENAFHDPLRALLGSPWRVYGAAVRRWLRRHSNLKLGNPFGNCTDYRLIILIIFLLLTFYHNYNLYMKVLLCKSSVKIIWKTEETFWKILTHKQGICFWM